MKAEKKDLLLPFHTQVCSICHGCQRDTAIGPEFCFTLAWGDTKKFLQMIRLIMVLQQKIPGFTKIKNMQDFCAIICASCTFKSKVCNTLAARIECYQVFYKSAHLQNIDENVRKLMCTIPANEDINVYLNNLEHMYQNYFLESINKKGRKKLKRIKKNLSYIIAEYDKQLKQTKMKKTNSSKKDNSIINAVDTQKVSTAFFYNQNNLDWEHTLNELFSV